MTKISFCLGLVLLSLFLAGGFFHPAEGESSAVGVCAECGMRVNSDSRFSARAIDTEGRSLSFCDVGDMLRHFRDKKKDILSLSVKDFSTGKTIDGKKAFFVKGREIHTPMSWGIVAFESQGDARAVGTPMIFDQAFGLLK